MSDKNTIWPMTDVQISEIRERCEKASPGPWVADEYANGVDLGYKPDHERTWGYGCGNGFVCDLNDGEYHEYCSEDEQRANAEFIAHAREDVPLLLGEVERLRAENESLKNCAFELGVVFSTRGNEMRAREEWFVTYIINKNPFLCPMPKGMCDQQYGRMCCLNSSETERRKQCWRKAAEIETREHTGNSGEVQENPGEEKNDGQEKGN